MLPWILLGSAALGYLKSQEDAKAYKQQQKVESTKERWSSFTGQHGQNLKKPNRMDPIMQSMMAGGMMASQFQGGDAAAATAGTGTADPSQGAPAGSYGDQSYVNATGGPARAANWQPYNGPMAPQQQVSASYAYPYRQPQNLYAMEPN